jgi:hypothetical protein
MLKKSAAALVLFLAATAPVLAASRAGVTLPDTVQVDGKTLLLNGLGLREATFLKIDVYVAGLYVEKKSADPAALMGPGPKQLRMHFVRGVGSADLVKNWQEGIARNVKGAAADAVKERFERVYAVMADVAEGDEMVLTEIPEKGVTLSIKGKDLVTIPGDDFAKALWSIWLGTPPNPELKEGLLGKLD